MPAPAITIRDAVVASIIALGLEGLETDASVKHRKRPVRLRDDPDPMCIIVVGREVPAEGGRTNQTQALNFPVLVVLVRKQALTVVRSDDWVEESRYAIQNALWRGLFLGLNGGVRRCQYDSDPPFSLDGYEAGWDVSGQKFTYTYEEAKPPQGDQ